MTNKLKIQLDISKEMDLEHVPFILIARLAAQMGAYLDMSGGRLRVVTEKPDELVYPVNVTNLTTRG